MEMLKPHKNCLWCNDPLRGRSDKKFCDINCRNSYNNRQDLSVAHRIKTINYALRKNRNILAEIFQQQSSPTTIPREVLQYKGFQFRFHTEVLGVNSGSPLFICYDYGYQLTETDQVCIQTISDDLFSSWKPSQRTRSRHGI